MDGFFMARMAVEETGMGVMEDKVIKNHYAAEYIYNKYKDMKTCGVVEDDPAGWFRRGPSSHTARGRGGHVPQRGAGPGGQALYGGPRVRAWGSTMTEISRHLPRRPNTRETE